MYPLSNLAYPATLFPSPFGPEGRSTLFKVFRGNASYGLKARLAVFWLEVGQVVDCVFDLKRSISMLETFIHQPNPNQPTLFVHRYCKPLGKR